jgi:DNA polymerase III psi subunit
MLAVHNPRIDYMILSPYECEWVWSQSSRGLWDADCQDVTAEEDFSDPSFERYMRSMFQRHMLIHRASRFLSKNPVNCLRIGYLHKLFPDAKIVTIVRDPLDTVLSHYQAALRMEDIFHNDPETRLMLQERLHMDLLSMVIKTLNYAKSQELKAEHRLLGIANQWNDMQSAVMKNVAETDGLKEQVLSLRYEDLMAAPLQTLNQIWDFTGLNDEHANRISMHYAEQLTAPEPVALSEADREFLPRVREILAPTAHQLGYSLEN